MSALLKPKMTAAEYLAIERKAEFKSEFFGGEMFAMAGASRFHNRVKDRWKNNFRAKPKNRRLLK